MSYPLSMQMTHKNTYISIQTQMLMSRRQSAKWNCVVQKSETGCDKLKSNKGKMKVMFFGKTSDLKKLNITSICIGDFRIIPSLVATNFGVDLDLGLKMEKQVNKMVSSGWYHLSNISRVRKYFTQEATEALVHAFVMSKLDAYNSF